MNIIEVLNNLKQQTLDQIEQNKKGIKEVVDAGLISHERIFPIINKIDRIWNNNPTLPFCEIVKLIDIEQYTNDLLLTKRLDELIDEKSTTE